MNNIICGDCRNLISKLSPDFVLTSPPYNQGKSIAHQSAIYKYYDDNLTSQKYYSFLIEVIDKLLKVTKKQVFFNIQYNSKNKESVFKLIGNYYSKIKDILIWSKPFPPPSINTNVLTHNYEFILVLDNNNSNRKYDMNFGHKGKIKTCFTEEGNGFTNKEQFTCSENFAIMPINLARYIIKTFTKKGDVILDPFCGTATVCVACKVLMRNYIGIDISEEMIKIANKRLNDAGGLIHYTS